MRYLLSEDANPFLVDRAHLRTALHCAAAYGHADVMAVLLEDSLVVSRIRYEQLPLIGCSSVPPPALSCCPLHRALRSRTHLDCLGVFVLTAIAMMPTASCMPFCPHKRNDTR